MTQRTILLSAYKSSRMGRTVIERYRSVYVAGGRGREEDTIGMDGNENG